MSSSPLSAQLAAFRASGLPDQQAFVKLVDEFRSSADDVTLPAVQQFRWEFSSIGSNAAQHFTGDEIAKRIAWIVLLNLSRGNAYHPVSGGFISAAINGQDFPGHRHLVDLIRELGLPDDALGPKLVPYCSALSFAWKPKRAKRHYYVENWDAPEEPSFSDPLEHYVASFSDAVMSETLACEVSTSLSSTVRAPRRLIGTMAKFRPATLTKWLANVERTDSHWPAEWAHVLAATDRWDRHFEKIAHRMSPAARLPLLTYLLERGRAANAEQGRQTALDPGQVSFGEALVFLSRHSRADFPPHFHKLLDESRLFGPIYSEEAFAEASRDWERTGKAIFAKVLQADLEKASNHPGRAFNRLFVQALGGLLSPDSQASEEEMAAWFAETLRRHDHPDIQGFDRTESFKDLWETLGSKAGGRMLDTLFIGLSDSSKIIRGSAISGIETHPHDIVRTRVLDQLKSKKTDARLGSAELLSKMGDATVTPALLEALSLESSDKVRAVLHEALLARGVKPPPKPLAELETVFAAARKKLKLPGSAWLRLQSLPPLPVSDGKPLGEDGIAFLLAKQAAFKGTGPSPEVEPLLEHLDRRDSAAFAAALVEGFLASEQSASDRWAMTLGGLLGDSRIIPPLLARIPGWCENARHKLAEYAVQAISLLPGNEPLMVLDSLSNRYRNKFKNIGKASSEAFMAAATARGITADELGDMVVPTFEFDDEGVRRFEWDGGGASTELGPDFKLSWFDPDTDKSWKALPASAPEAVKTEVKTLTKMLREAVKAQTPRLEMAMVRQRRWTPERWRELYENHPLLRSFASRLVWGIYDASGSMIRSFRRYPNGILANAEGAMEELTESDILIGIAHPLEMEAPALEAWRAHLKRFKVAPPFAQIDRPVETLDPLHGNRREISMTRDRKITAGSLRSRGEKRGWVRGSVIDGGSVSSFYKPYPGAGVEVILPTEGLWMGCDPMEEVQLSAAYFVKGGAVDRGSYVYDEPSSDDPNVLRFDAVPPVVWSETLSDLKAILGESS